MTFYSRVTSLKVVRVLENVKGIVEVYGIPVDVLKISAVNC